MSDPPRPFRVPGARARPARRALVLRPDGDGGPAPEIETVLAGDGRSVTVHPHGELDLRTAPELEATCLAAMATCDRVVVDLSAVTFLDSSTLAVLVEVRRAALARAATVTLTGLSPRARRLLQITRLDQVFDVE